MAKTKTTLNWKQVDPGSLQPKVVEAYIRCESVNAKAKLAREKFERLCTKTAGIPDSQRFLFSYKFGQLSIAIDSARTKKVSSKAIDFESLKTAVRDATEGARSARAEGCTRLATPALLALNHQKQRKLH